MTLKSIDASIYVVNKRTKPNLEKVAIAYLKAEFVLRMYTNCYFRASDQNSYIANRLSDPDFLKRSNNLAIIRIFHAVTLI